MEAFEFLPFICDYGFTIKLTFLREETNLHQQELQFSMTITRCQKLQVHHLLYKNLHRSQTFHTNSTQGFSHSLYLHTHFCSNNGGRKVYECIHNKVSTCIPSLHSHFSTISDGPHDGRSTKSIISTT